MMTELSASERALVFFLWAVCLMFVLIVSGLTFQASVIFTGILSACYLLACLVRIIENRDQSHKTVPVPISQTFLLEQWHEHYNEAIARGLTPGEAEKFANDPDPARLEYYGS
jgi:hypothetical protein